MLLSLVVDKAGMVQCSEAAALFSAKMNSVGCCLPCFTTTLLLNFAALLFSFLDVVHVATLSLY